MTLPAADIGAVADRHRRDQRRIRADEDAGADLGAVLGEAVIVAGDGAGADIGFGADAGIADIGEMVGLGAGARSSAFLISTKLPIWASAPISAPGLSRAKGPMLGAFATRCARLSICEKARMVTSSSMIDAGAEDDMRLDSDIAADPGVGTEKDGFGRDERGAARHGGFAVALLDGGFDAGAAGRGC